MLPTKELQKHCKSTAKASAVALAVAKALEKLDTDAADPIDFEPFFNENRQAHKGLVAVIMPITAKQPKRRVFFLFGDGFHKWLTRGGSRGQGRQTLPQSGEALTSGCFVVPLSPLQNAIPARHNNDGDDNDAQ